MSPTETEAEALLRSGALYPFRLGLQPPDGPLIFAGLKHGALSLYVGDDPSYHFDLEGRWQRCHVDPSHLLRRLDGSTQAIDRPRVGRNLVLDRRTLGDDEAAALDEAIRRMAAELADGLDSGAIAVEPPPTPARPIEVDRLLGLLRRVARWDAPAWAEHRRRYRDAYGPIPFLPPDSLDALVLQATVPPDTGGGSGVRSPEAFAAHCRAVAALLGEGIVSYRTLFLAGPDALRRPADEAEAYLRIALDAFPLAESPAPARRSDLPVDRPHREGIHALIGRSDGPIPDASAWPRFRSLGLRRVSLGLAVGDPPAPSDAITPRGDLAPIAQGARSAGIAISVVAWIDPADGPAVASDASRAADLIRSLGLGAGDHVYLVEDDAPAPSAASLMEALAPLRREAGVKVLPYSARKQGN